MAAKILINGKAGVGKSTLIKDLKKVFVISRDGKNFPFELPHMLVPTYYGMSTILHGGSVKNADGTTLEVEGVFAKLQKYVDRFGELPETVVIDSVSKLMTDAIEYSVLHYENFDVHTSINKEVAFLTTFIQEELVANGVNVVLINHVMDNDKKGLVPIGQGKFKDKGGFYSEVDYSLLVTDTMQVVHRGATSQARTLLTELPDKQHIANIQYPEKSKKLKEGEEYFDLQTYIDRINTKASVIADKYEL